MVQLPRFARVLDFETENRRLWSRAWAADFVHLMMPYSSQHVRSPRDRLLIRFRIAANSRELLAILLCCHSRLDIMQFPKVLSDSSEQGILVCQRHLVPRFV